MAIGCCHKYLGISFSTKGKGKLLFDLFLSPHLLTMKAITLLILLLVRIFGVVLGVCPGSSVTVRILPSSPLLPFVSCMFCSNTFCRRLIRNQAMEVLSRYIGMKSTPAPLCLEQVSLYLVNALLSYPTPLLLPPSSPSLSLLFPFLPSSLFNPSMLYTLSDIFYFFFDKSIGAWGLNGPGYTGTFTDTIYTCADGTMGVVYNRGITNSDGMSFLSTIFFSHFFLLSQVLIYLPVPLYPSIAYIIPTPILFSTLTSLVVNMRVSYTASACNSNPGE